MKEIRFRAPEKLTTGHNVAEFDSGEPTLDNWLRKHALQNESRGASRTYVLCTGAKVAGYYSLAAGAIGHEHAPGRVRRNMPDPVPVMLLGRLAVDRSFQGQGLGIGLLRDAVLRTMQASEIAGIRAMLVQAISDQARRFYEGCGFVPSPANPLTLMIPLSEAEKILAEF